MVGGTRPMPPARVSVDSGMVDERADVVVGGQA
jgi:hypothetical protein